MKLRNSIIVASVLLSCNTYAQFAPPAVQEGTTAIHKDSAIFVNWAKSCEVERGPMDIRNPSEGLASAGDTSNAIGPATGTAIVSLGDGGNATLTFDPPIKNALGADFAVFENSFSDTFLELAFVEVSSNGEDFVRFPAVSNTQTNEPVGSFGLVEASKIYNLAGKYRGTFGTPFDLEELQDHADLDINQISHVRIVDAIGSIEDNYATFDSQGNKVNAIFPTPFPSGGFDLDAIGVIHEYSSVNTYEFAPLSDLSIYPNPTSDVVFIKSKEMIHQITLMDVNGKVLEHKNCNQKSYKLEVGKFPKGLYFLNMQFEESQSIKKLMIN